MYIVAHCPYATAVMLRKSAVAAVVAAASMKRTIVAVAATADPADVSATLLPLKIPPAADAPVR